jgi:NADH-quinone oxidoreductase subunit M
MLLLTTALTPIIIYTSFGLNIKCEAFYSLTCLCLCNGWTFLAADGLLYYIWELSLIPIYFIALIWGNGDAEERKSSSKILYLHLLVRYLCYCIHILISTREVSWLRIIQIKLISNRTIMDIPGILLAYAIKIQLFLSTLGKQMYTKSTS